MRLVRRTRPGMRSRSLAKSSKSSALVSRRFMAFKMPSLQCWIGMSRYGTIFSSRATVSMSSSVTSSG